MATPHALTGHADAPAHTGAALLVVLPAADPGQLEPLVVRLARALPAERLLFALPEGIDLASRDRVSVVNLPAANLSWTLTAANFAHAHALTLTYQPRSVLLLGPEAHLLAPGGLQDLVGSTIGATADLVVPHYELPTRSGLVNSAILYPLCRALFAARARFPLAVDLGLSPRTLAHLATSAQRLIALHQPDAPLWPVNEAAVAGFSVDEVDVGPRPLPQPAEPDLNSILSAVAGSLFSDVEAKAAFWQRARIAPPARWPSSAPRHAGSDSAAEIASLLQAFRLACANLQELWGLILPPQTLLALKRLSQAEASAFRLPENLWARIVFDFLVAYRLRSLNRSHLFASLLPLYRAWVASHLSALVAGADAERLIETQAIAFETEKPYLVARWRWPDRFNP